MTPLSFKMIRQFGILLYIFVSTVKCYLVNRNHFKFCTDRVVNGLRSVAIIDGDSSIADCCDRGSFGDHPTTSSLCGPGPIEMTSLSDENIVKIVRMECTDADANVLVWKCLGYVYDEKTQSWDSSNVFPKW